MNINQSQQFWCEQKSTKVLTPYNVFVLLCIYYTLLCFFLIGCFAMFDTYLCFVHPILHVEFLRTFSFGSCSQPILWINAKVTSREMSGLHNGKDFDRFRSVRCHVSGCTEFACLACQKDRSGQLPHVYERCQSPPEYYQCNNQTDVRHNKVISFDRYSYDFAICFP